MCSSDLLLCAAWAATTAHDHGHIVLPDQERDVSRIAAHLKLRDEFEQEGLKVALPAPVYRSRRRGRGTTMLGRGPRPRR